MRRIKRKPKDLYEWLKVRLTLLFKFPKLSEIYPEVYNECGVWSPLKIIGIGYFASIYSRIIPKQSWVQKWYYIDLFAGSGLCKVAETGDIILGSSIHVPDSFKSLPSKMFFVEKDSEKATALKERLNYLQKSVRNFGCYNWEVKEGDCNIAIDEILEECEEESRKGEMHYLAFIDPYAREIKASTMKKLLEFNGDIVFTLQSFLLDTRIRGKAKEETQNEFFGGDYWKKATNSRNLFEMYIESIIHNKRDITLDFQVRKGRGEPYYYDWVLAVRKTASGSQWLRSMDDFKRKIARCTGKDVKRILDVIKGRRLDLSKFTDKERLDYYFLQ